MIKLSLYNFFKCRNGELGEKIVVIIITLAAGFLFAWAIIEMISRFG